MKTENLITMFNLTKEVDKFVKERVKDLMPDCHTFRFSGDCAGCGNSQPHIPHTLSYYDTVNHGELENYCLGQEGQTSEGEVVIVVENYSSGSPEYPSSARGFWFVKKEEK